MQKTTFCQWYKVMCKYITTNGTCRLLTFVAKVLPLTIVGIM